MTDPLERARELQKMLKGLDEVRDAARDRQHARRGEASLTVGSREALCVAVSSLTITPGGFILGASCCEGPWSIEGEVEGDPQGEAFTLVTGFPNSEQHAWLNDDSLFSFEPGSRIAVTRQQERLRFRFSGVGRLTRDSSPTSVQCAFSGHCGADVNPD